ncbi:hypothetical protein [Natronobacterium haloterrestre]|nr:hypothetical protein [Halobiforma haloterrestris]
MAAGIVIPYLSDYTMFDEHDDAIRQQASGVTLAVFGWLAAIGFPSLGALSTTTYLEWGP